MTLGDARIVSFVGVSDLDAAELFYGGVLGLSLEDVRPFALVADTGASQLRITAVGDVHAAPHTVLGWQVNDIEVTVDELVANRSAVQPIRRIGAGRPRHLDGPRRCPNRLVPRH
jgi:catechol 2,3-dioxygenase-like lactoylglutathione lyase family enzyme